MYFGREEYRIWWTDGRAVRRAEAGRFSCFWTQKYLQFLQFLTGFVQFRAPAAPSQTLPGYVVQMLKYTNFCQNRLKYQFSGGHPPTLGGVRTEMSNSLDLLGI